MDALDKLLDTLPAEADILSLLLEHLPAESDIHEMCRSVMNTPKTASHWAKHRRILIIGLIILVFEMVRYGWHHIRLIALNFRRHTPPSTSYTQGMTFDEHAAFVERIFCDRADVAFCIEGLFMHRKPLDTITRSMLEDVVLAHLAMEVRRWYPKKHHDTADRIIERIEDKLGFTFKDPKSTRERLDGGASIAQPIPFDAHPDAFRKPFLYIGEQRLCAYYKPLPVQWTVWMGKFLTRVLLWVWGFRWQNLGPVQVWMRQAPKGESDEMHPPLLFCPGLFLGNTAYLYWIYHGLLPLGKRRTLILLELPHLSHGVNPRNVAYSLWYSWPNNDEICDAIAAFVEEFKRPVDIMGNSFGTVIMTVLRREHLHLFRKFVYVDPVCFGPCFPGAFLACAAPQLDSYKTLLKEALRPAGRIPLLARLFKFLVLRPTIFGDVEVQYVMKRGLYVHEATERGTLGPESFVWIGGQDELLHTPSDLCDWIKSHWPQAALHMGDFNHGAIMGRPQAFTTRIWDFLYDGAFSLL
eukprot:TRINITY_DN25814_c0_g1_i1.p1 TRINITY_DN25814_c0_g1~~TRINITY_DN25814_c0_g1_i1.p1  ORF type:complete len:524 (+),score=45.79 TRINITY_DN25814_c0_g1_i1:80-1651(+)